MAFKALLAVFLVALFAIVEASHFRYGSMTVTKNPSNPRQLTFSYAMGAKRSYYGSPNVGSVLSSAVGFYMNGGFVAYLNPVVTNIDIANDILYASTTYVYTASGAGVWNGYAYSSARISNLNNNANQAFQMGATAKITAAEISSGIVNNSPSTSSLPIITVPYGVVGYQYQIPANDPENDALVFSMASNSQMGGGSNSHPSGLTISSSGLVTLGTALGLGFWSTQHIITDSFGNYACVDYMLNVVVATAYCSDSGSSCSQGSQCSSGSCVNPLPEIFTNDLSSGAAKRTNLPAPANGAVLTVAAGSVLTVNIVADDANLYHASSPVVISWASLPSHSSVSTQSQCDSLHGCSCVGCNSQPQLSTLTYSPTSADGGSHVICLSVTSLGTPLPYSQHCFSVIVTVAPTQVCGNGIIEGTEQCDGGNCCSGTCSFSSSSTVCRASAGDCDVAETCSGSSASCPSDSFQSSSTVCRSSAGVCDVAESCTGSSASCPSDSFQSSSTVCRSSNGVCDVAESCTGSSASCPSDSFQSSSTVCRAAAGVCDNAESCTGSSASCPSDSFKSSSAVCRASIGPCDPQETCSGSGASCPSDISGAFESSCSGLDIDFGADGQYSMLNYDVISFDTFVGPTGACDGRLAVKNDISVGTSYAGGYSVGYFVHTDPNDVTLPYSVVAGGALTFGGGAVYPDGNAYAGHPAGTRENIFVGSGSFTGQADLRDRVHGNCSGSNGCLNSYFSAVQSCYGGFQTAWAAQTDNVQKLIQWSGLYLDCQDPTSATKIYYLTLTATELTQFTWFSVSNCNANARWIINVPGTDSVTFTAGSFPAPANAVVYNVLGSGRTINVVNVYLQGHVVAPYNTLNQPSGNIVGKVIAGNIPASLNINRVQCFFPQ